MGGDESRVGAGALFRQPDHRGPQPARRRLASQNGQGLSQPAGREEGPRFQIGRAGLPLPSTGAAKRVRRGREPVVPGAGVRGVLAADAGAFCREQEAFPGGNPRTEKAAGEPGSKERPMQEFHPIPGPALVDQVFLAGGGHHPAGAGGAIRFGAALEPALAARALVAGRGQAGFARDYSLARQSVQYLAAFRTEPRGWWSAGAAPSPGHIQPPVEDAAANPAGAPHIGGGVWPWPWLWLWAAGAVFMAAGLGINHFRIHRRVTRCRPLINEQVLNLLEDCKQRMGVQTPITLVETEAVEGPCLFGGLRPRLLLPPGFTRGFSLDELRYVFLHELGHVKRRDIASGVADGLPANPALVQSAGLAGLFPDARGSRAGLRRAGAVARGGAGQQALRPHDCEAAGEFWRFRSGAEPGGNCRGQTTNERKNHYDREIP